MRIAIVSLSSLMFFPGCSSGQERAAALPEPMPPELIRFAVIGQNGTDVWVSYANGRTTHDAYDGAQKATSGSQLSTPSAAIQRLAAALRSYESAQGVSCPKPDNDAPKGELSWGRGIQTVSLQLRQGCGAPEVAAAFEDAIAASRVIAVRVGDEQWREIDPEAAEDFQTPTPTAKAVGAAVITSDRDDLDAISYVWSGGGFSSNRTLWSLDAQGRGSYQSVSRTGSQSRTFSVGPEGFEKVRENLASIENLQDDCETGVVSDQPVATWSWVRGDQTKSVMLEQGCAPPESASANSMIRGWARQDP